MNICRFLLSMDVFELIYVILNPDSLLFLSIFRQSSLTQLNTVKHLVDTPCKRRASRAVMTVYLIVRSDRHSAVFTLLSVTCNKVRYSELMSTKKVAELMTSFRKKSKIITVKARRFVEIVTLRIHAELRYCRNWIGTINVRQTKWTALSLKKYSFFSFLRPTLGLLIDF